MIDKIKHIKHSRTKPEEIWFLDMITDLEEVRMDEYPNSVFWKKNDKNFFEQDFEKMKLWVDYNNIWKFFSIKCGYKHVDIQVFIKNMVEEHLNWKGFKPIYVKII